MEILEAKTVEDIEGCFDVVQVLRPHIKSKEELSSKVLLQHSEGYHLMYIRDTETAKAVSIIGYRINNFLWSGKTLYIDDLCTTSASRGKGHGRALLQWCIQRAKDENCEYVSLDSGYTRNDAHRLYLNCGFQLNSHHFGIKL